MRKIFLVSCLTLLSSVAHGQQDGSKKPLSKAEISFREKVFDFADMLQGDRISKKFFFKNSGSEPLMILNVQTTCGCTASEWPKSPIPPGDSSSILVTFNSAKKQGRINKVITVYSNARTPEEKLKISGNVVLPETQPQPEGTNPKKD